MIEQKNSVTIFTNGVANFERVYDLQKDKPYRISLNFKNEYLGDVAGTIGIFGQNAGDISILEFPNYSPSKEKPTLTLCPKNITEQLSEKLSGAEIIVTMTNNNTYNGTLMGIETESQDHGTYKTEYRYIAIMDKKDTYHRIALENIRNIRFEDEVIRNEIKKALSYNLEQVKPNSTPVYMTVKGNKNDTKAYVNYTIPSPVWKRSYRLNKSKNGIELCGFAIIDNDTDEDWKDFTVEVVTGSPITFNSQLAKVHIPKRHTLSLLEETTQIPPTIDISGGAVNTVACAAPPPAKTLNRVSLMAPVMETSKEVEDFSHFKATAPVTIEAHKSVVLPIFNTWLKDAEMVLHYKYSNNTDRPMRCILMKNNEKYTLGHGQCSVNTDDTHSGSCEFNATKPGESSILSYAVETGVRFARVRKPVEQSCTKLKISEGVAISETTNQCETIYRISNLTEEKFNVMIDHELALPDSTIKKCTTRIKEKLKNGFRSELALEPNQQTEIVVLETKTERQSVSMGGSIAWLSHNIILTRNPLCKNENILNCIAIQKDIDNLEKEKLAITALNTSCEKESERLRKNLAAGGHTPDMDTWKSRLAENEKVIFTNERTKLPEIVRRKDSLQEKLQNELFKLSINWMP